MFFNVAIRPKVSEDNPNATFGDIGKTIGKLWKEISAQDKKVYMCVFLFL
jgi:hypothetical protein